MTQREVQLHRAIDTMLKASGADWGLHTYGQRHVREPARAVLIELALAPVDPSEAEFAEWTK